MMNILDMYEQKYGESTMFMGKYIHYAYGFYSKSIFTVITG